jgi:hypothetical protein
VGLYAWLAVKLRLLVTRISLSALVVSLPFNGVAEEAGSIEPPLVYAVENRGSSFQTSALPDIECLPSIALLADPKASLPNGDGLQPMLNVFLHLKGARNLEYFGDLS